MKNQKKRKQKKAQPEGSLEKVQKKNLMTNRYPFEA